MRKAYADAEARIYRLYKDYVTNDLHLEKQNTKRLVMRMKLDNKDVPVLLESLREENQSLKTAVGRYEKAIKNF